MGFFTKLKNKLLGKRKNSDDNTKAAAKVKLEKTTDNDDNDYNPLTTTVNEVYNNYISIADSFDKEKRLRSRRDIVLDSDRIAFKAVRDGIAVLKIPSGARVISPETGSMSKMRATEAEVLRVYEVARRQNICFSIDSIRDVMQENFDMIRIGHSRSLYDESFEYRAGETVEPDQFDTSLVPCGGGIHFFATPPEAVLWYGRT